MLLTGLFCRWEKEYNIVAERRSWSLFGEMGFTVEKGKTLGFGDGIYNLDAPLGGPTFVISLYSRLECVSL